MPRAVMLKTVTGTTSRFAHLEKLSLKISWLSILIRRVNLLHPPPSLFLCGLLLSLRCLSILLNSYFHVSFDLKIFLYLDKNIMAELLYVA